MKTRLVQKTCYTLVYDRFTNNHKIIALSLRYYKKIGVYVHTLGTDYWRKIQDLPCYFSDLKPGIFVSGTVNWLVDDDITSLPRVILYFDLEKESCQELLYPLSHESSQTSISLGALKDCLCIFSRNKKFSDIWMMKEYGNEKSWTKLFKIPYIGDSGLYWHTKALYIYEDDQVLVNFRKQCKFTLAVYDSKKDTFRILEIQNDIQAYVTEEIYVESLISP
jgi:F-box interacting protein